MKQDELSFYERFHRRTKVQKKIIEKRNFTYRNLISVLERYINDQDEILDIGCGAGTIDFYLASRGHKVLGIDIAGDALDRCEKSAQLLGLESKLSFEKLNFPEERPQGKFDLVICSEVLEHLKNDEKAISVIFELLRPGGFAVFSVPSQNAPLYKLGIAKEFDKKVGHLRRYSLKEIKALVSKEDFLICEVKKSEGIFRNFLFLNPVASMAIRFIRGSLSDLVTFIDNLSLRFFGESQIFVVAQK